MPYKSLVPGRLFRLDITALGVGTSAPQLIQPPPFRAGSLSPAARDTLSRFGAFTASDAYGEVWIPNVTPLGWHPYPPCHWVKALRWGLFYDDPSEWGQIVHHYGRWAHDDVRGWMWIAGNEFSPGWVVWRSSPAWTGWAPLPPLLDEAAAADAMAGTDSWLFQEVHGVGRQPMELRLASYDHQNRQECLHTQVPERHLTCHVEPLRGRCDADEPFPSFLCSRASSRVERGRSRSRADSPARGPGTSAGHSASNCTAP